MKYPSVEKYIKKIGKWTNLKFKYGRTNTAWLWIKRDEWIK